MAGSVRENGLLLTAPRDDTQEVIPDTQSAANTSHQCFACCKYKYTHMGYRQ